MSLLQSIPRLPLRIAAVCATVMVTVQVVNYWLVANHLERQARQATRSQLLAAGPSLSTLLEQRALRMIDAQRALAVQPQFAEAVARSDAGALDQPLTALSNKLATETVAVTDSRGLPLSSVSGVTASLIKALQASTPLPRDPDGEPVRHMVLVEWQLYQLVALPIISSHSTHWLLSAAPIDDATLGQWRQAAGGDTGLLIRQPHSSWHLMHGTIKQPEGGVPDTVWAEINPSQRPSARRPGGLTAVSAWLQPHINATEYDARFTLLTEGDPANTDQAQAGVIALAPVAADPENRQSLLGLLTIFSAVGCALLALVAFVVTRPIGSSLRRLTSWARSLQGGHYTTPPKCSGMGEAQDLSKSLDGMQKAVREREVEIMDLAYRDTLTNLPNREKFKTDLRKAIAQAIETNVPCSVLIMDLDRFKHVNDVLGHGFGDRLLRMVAQRLRDEVLDSSMPLARLGGDEFAVLLKKADAPAAKKVAKHIQHALERPLQLDDHTIDLGAGVGIASCPAHSTDADELLSRAEVAMYAAKQQHSCIVIFQPTLDAGSEASLSLLTELRRAVDENQLRLYLQPKVSLTTGSVIGAEALVRWQHPKRGLVPPTQFIPFAEKTGFVRTLTMWMLEHTARAWREMYGKGLTLKISVNLSTRDLLDQDLPTKIEQIVRRYKLTPGSLVLEITESATMDDPDRALQTLERLHALGLRLSIDDFGTGYSSLAYLKRLPVDELKIDKSFVMKMESDLDDAKIVRSTIDLAHNLGLSVVAEGIETEATWKLLTGLKCDEAQGYFIARPMPAEQLFDWVKTWRTPQTDNVSLATDFAKMI